MIVFTPNANAKTNATIVFKPYPETGTIDLNSGVYYAGEGDMNPSSATRGEYIFYNHYSCLILILN